MGFLKKSILFSANMGFISVICGIETEITGA